MTMTRDDIRSFMETMAASQGSWGRMLATIDAMEEDRQEQVWRELEEAGFTDPVDLCIRLGM